MRSLVVVEVKMAGVQHDLGRVVEQHAVRAIFQFIADTVLCRKIHKLHYQLIPCKVGRDGR